MPSSRAWPTGLPARRRLAQISAQDRLGNFAGLLSIVAGQAPSPAMAIDSGQPRSGMLAVAPTGGRPVATPRALADPPGGAGGLTSCAAGRDKGSMTTLISAKQKSRIHIRYCPRFVGAARYCYLRRISGPDGPPGHGAQRGGDPMSTDTAGLGARQGLSWSWEL